MDGQDVSEDFRKQARNVKGEKTSHGHPHLLGYLLSETRNSVLLETCLKATSLSAQAPEHPLV